MRDLLTLQDRIQARATDLGITLRFAGPATPVIPGQNNRVLVEVHADDVDTFDEICNIHPSDEPDGFGSGWYGGPWGFVAQLRQLFSPPEFSTYLVPQDQLTGLLDRLELAATRLAGSGGTLAKKHRQWAIALFALAVIGSFLLVREGHYLTGLVAATAAYLLHLKASQAEDDIRIARWLRAKADRT